MRGAGYRWHIRPPAGVLGRALHFPHEPDLADDHVCALPPSAPWPNMVGRSKIFQMRASPKFFGRIDEFRREEPGLPSRAEALRRLVEAGLRAKRASLHHEVIDEFSRFGVTHEAPFRRGRDK
jgi:hypothetical protein